MDRPSILVERGSVCQASSCGARVEPLALAAGTVAAGDDAIREFAKKFEQVFISTKLATGLARASDAESDSQNRLWVHKSVPRSHIRSTQNQHFFAPDPSSHYIAERY
jgi:hypothetical protein